MKTKSNNNPSKLQSEAVLEFNKIYGKRLDTMEMLYLNHGGEQFEGKIIQDFISDQIQKAYSKGREEVLKEIEAKQKDENDIYDKIKFIIENPPLPNKKLIKAFKEFKNLSIQSKGNMK